MVCVSERPQLSNAFAVGHLNPFYYKTLKQKQMKDYVTIVLNYNDKESLYKIQKALLGILQVSATNEESFSLLLKDELYWICELSQAIAKSIEKLDAE